MNCDHVFEPIESNGGSILGHLCKRCYVIRAVCRVCRREFKQVYRHHLQSECGKFDNAGLWWTSERPPIAERFAAGLNGGG
jgi:hypothetical protein